MVYWASKWINLFPITPATSFSAGRVVINWWTVSLWINDKMSSSLWNAWLNQGFPVTFQATRAKDLFITKGWSSLFRFFKTHWSTKSSENDIARRFGCQGWVCHAGVILLHWLSPLLFCKVLSELTKTGEMHIKFPGSILVALHLQLNCVGLVSKQDILLFDWIIWKQTDLSLTSLFSKKHVGILLEITSIATSLCCNETGNLFLCSEYPGDIPQ